MLTVFFKEGGVDTYEDAMASNTELYGKWFRAALAEGVYMAPSQFEAAFISMMHTEDVLGRAVLALEKAFKY